MLEEMARLAKKQDDSRNNGSRQAGRDLNPQLAADRGDEPRFIGVQCASRLGFSSRREIHPPDQVCVSRVRP